MAKGAEAKYYNGILIGDNLKVWEVINMTVMSMKLNIGYFHINIKIGKNKKEKDEISIETICHDKKMKEALEEKKFLAQNFLKLNIF